MCKPKRVQTSCQALFFSSFGYFFDMSNTYQYNSIFYRLRNNLAWNACRALTLSSSKLGLSFNFQAPASSRSSQSLNPSIRLNWLFLCFSHSIYYLFWPFLMIFQSSMQQVQLALLRKIIRKGLKYEKNEEYIFLNSLWFLSKHYKWPV